MASTRARPGIAARILLGIARALATIVLAVVASAALAELELEPVEFQRVLPVVVTGEGILYILMLGGGAVAGPVLLLTVVLAFAMRAGVAVAAGYVSPQAGGELIADAKFYYASYWPSAVAQVLLMAVMLRLIRPLIARRRRRPAARLERRAEPEPAAEERREVLLEAIAESPDVPPESPTVLEEREIGDLAEPAEASEDEPQQELALPFDEREEPEEEGEAVEEPEETEEPPLPPGVLDATPEAEAGAEAIEEEAAAGNDTRKMAPSAAAGEEAPGPGAPGEDTARLEPALPPEDVAPAAPENLQEMMDVISGAAGHGTEMRVWGTTDARTVLAAVPSGTPAAGTAAHADGLVRAHLRLCTLLGAEATSLQLTCGPLGAYALRGLDERGAVMLLMAARGEDVAGRLELTASQAAEAVRGMAESAPAPEDTAAEVETPALEADDALAGVVADAARVVAGRLAEGWRAFRAQGRRAVAVMAPPGVDGRVVAEAVVAGAERVEGFTDALALDRPRWLALTSGAGLLVTVWAEIGDGRLLLAALAADGGAVGRARWELEEIARRIGAEGA